MKNWSQDDANEFIAKTQSQSRQQIESLRESGLWNQMDQDEHEFMGASPLDLTEQALIDASWHSEACVCLLWALDKLSELPPYDTKAGPELTNQVFEKKPILRSFAHLTKQRDFAELWHWRSRTRKLQELGRIPQYIARRSDN